MSKHTSLDVSLVSMRVFTGADVICTSVLPLVGYVDRFGGYVLNGLQAPLVHGCVRARTQEALWL